MPYGDSRRDGGARETRWPPPHLGVWARYRVWRLKGFGRAEKIVLAALASYMDRAGTCYPSLSLLAEVTELTERSVSQTIGALAHCKVLRVIKHPRHSNRYVLQAEALRDWTSIDRRAWTDRGKSSK